MLSLFYLQMPQFEIGRVVPRWLSEPGGELYYRIHVYFSFAFWARLQHEKS